MPPTARTVYELDPTTAVNLIPWVLVGAMTVLLVTVLAVAIRRVATFTADALDAIAKNLTADVDTARAATTAQAKLLGDLTTSFTEAMATLAKATSFYVAGDGGQGTPPDPNVVPLQTREDIAARLYAGMPAAGLPDNQVYIDWTDSLDGLDTDPEARARFIPPGANPLDIIRGPRGDGDGYGPGAA